MVNILLQHIYLRFFLQNTWLASRVRAVLYPIAFKYLELGHEIGIDLWLKIMEEAKEVADILII